MSKFKVNNVFGIVPTRNCAAAGNDFYIPNIPGMSELSDEMLETILIAFIKSYGLTKEAIVDLCNQLLCTTTALYGEECVNMNELNILHLYLAISSKQMVNIDTFFDEYLIFDNNGVAGIKLHINDHIKINSGIRTIIEPGHAGIFFNKSGKGTKGWDIRACVVDEDYRGYVHLSMSFTSELEENSKIFCGDKLTQMVILPVVQDEPEVLNDDEYLNYKSERGDNGFGSSDEKHS